MPQLDDFQHGLSEAERCALLRAFQFAITPEMAALMDEPAIAAQFLPQAEELKLHPNEALDPIGDGVHSPLPHLIHRYPSRVLWKIAPTCAVYCRFCFRKEAIGRKGEALTAADRAAAFAYIKAHPEIEEVIFSGGDPLQLTPSQLAAFMEALPDIPHLQRLRLHTRIPVVAPSRITPELLQQFKRFPLPKLMVIHINHAAELTAAAVEALQALREVGFLLFSQSVLLKGVNNNVAALSALMNALLRCGVAPYYLHHLDWARGTQHFRISLREGLALEEALRQRLAGLAMPTYIVEIPGGGGKIPVHRLRPEQLEALDRGEIPPL